MLCAICQRRIIGPVEARVHVSPEPQTDREVCKLVHQFARGLAVHARRVADQLGLTAPQVVALRELSEPITARDLAVRMACEPSNITFVLDRLEQDGLVERRPHPTDRRAKQIELTTEGLRRRDEVLEHMRIQSPLGALTSAQQRTLHELLTAVVAGREAET